MGNRLGIIAGSGSLPVEISKSVDRAFVVGIDGFCDADMYDCDCEIFGLAKIGSIVNALKNAGVSDVIIAGGIERPALSKLMPDRLGAKLIARLALKGGGDDSALRIVVQFLQEQGFTVKSVDDVLGHQSIDCGILGTVKPNGMHLKDIERGREILNATSTLDIGQSVVIQEGLTIAVEAIEGTDAMISRTKSLVRNGNSPVLVKMIKTCQSRTVDLPTIGLDTIKNLSQNGFGGIAVSADGIIILNKEAVIEKANKLGLFIVAT